MKKLLLILMLIFALPANAMICLDNTDTLEGGASVTNVVDYLVHGLVGTTFTNIAQGQLSDTDPSVLYTAGAAISIVSTTYVNTHSSAVTVNLYLDPANAGTPRRMIPKNLSLGIGYSMHFDGAKITIIDTNGGIVSGINVSDTAYGAGWNGVTTIAPSKNAVYDQMELKAPKATPTFTGQATIPTINLTGSQIAFPDTAVPSADANTIDDYDEGTWMPTLTCSTSGSYTLSASVNTLSYTKIGRNVHIQGLIDITGENAPNGILRLSIPFVVASLTEDADKCLTSFVLRDHGDAGIENPLLLGFSNNFYFSLHNMPDNGTIENIDHTRVDAVFTIYVSSTYFTT